MMMAGGGALRRWTREEVAARNRRDHAALIIDNVVYDVTEWIEHHPGGPEVLLDNAGGDNSQCFLDVGHSDDAVQWRARFKVGDVVPEQRRAPAVRRTAPARAPADAAGCWSAVRAAAPPVALAVLALLLYYYLLS